MASDAPFKRGDIVVYKHTSQGSTSRDGSVGIATGELDSCGNPYIEWIYWAGDKRCALSVVYAHNLQKLGEICPSSEEATSCE